MANVIKDGRFKLVTEFQKPDAKMRLSIGMAVEEPQAAFNVYRNALGQIILDPVKTVPVHEAWIFENRDALNSVKRGLADAAAGRTKNLGSFAEFAPED